MNQLTDDQVKRLSRLAKVQPCQAVAVYSGDLRDLLQTLRHQERLLRQVYEYFRDFDAAKAHDSWQSRGSEVFDRHHHAYWPLYAKVKAAAGH